MKIHQTLKKNYEEEFRNVLIATWTQSIENGEENVQEQLEIIQTVDFSFIVAKLKESFSDYEGDFETELKNIFIKRHETLIAIMKEHIKEEFYEIKIRGLKPNFVKRIYQEFHGIEPK
jgi:flavodoxin